MELKTDAMGTTAVKWTAVRQTVESAWEDRSLCDQTATQEAVESVMAAVDAGELRCAAPLDDGWQVNEWVR